jgi:1,2-diacylglycerol 3-alpha-glucosyltransferase/glucuronosyltransferase
LPVAAYPVTGPLDVIADSGAGAMNDELEAAIESALGISPDLCRAHALTFSWSDATQQFLAHVLRANAGAPASSSLPVDAS